MVLIQGLAPKYTRYLYEKEISTGFIYGPLKNSFNAPRSDNNQ